MHPRRPTTLALACAAALAGPAAAVTVQKAFVPDTVPAGSATALTFTFTTAADEGGRSDVRLVDVLPDGLVVSFGTGGTCVNASAATTATAGTSTITVFNLEVAPGPTSCTVTVSVTSKPGRFNESCVALPADFTNDNTRVTLTNATSAIAPSCLRALNLIFANQFE